MTVFRQSSIFLAIVLLVFGVSGVVAQSNQRGIDPNNFDTTVSPCQNFYQFANGNWLKNNPIPAAYPYWGTTYELIQRNSDLLKEILESSAANTDAPRGTNLQKIGDFYAIAMDTIKIENDGMAPLKKDLDRIAAITTIQDLQRVITEFHNEGLGMVFDAGAEQDMKNSNMLIVYATQGGIGLPDRDYYTRTDDESKTLRDQYIEHITAMFKLLGDSEESSRMAAQSVMKIETGLAEASLTNVELRDPKAFYNIMTVTNADKQTPNFSWSAYLKAIGHPEIEEFSYAHPKFFARMNSLLIGESIENWKSYLRWNVVHSFAPYMSSVFVNENFRFYAATLAGTKELRPRWKRVLSATNNYLGEALGQLYVEKAFPPNYKARALEMVNNLKIALGERIRNLAWMTDSTKQMALKKLAKFNVKIGYPDKWRDYSPLEIDRSSYVENIRRCRAFETRRNLNKIGKPVDRTEWGMAPQEVNAYYNPLMNEIVFPAAILQPPVFDGEIDDAVNYGAIGSVIGHEMTHGYDNAGSQFDAEGNLVNWWTETDAKEFEKRSEQLVKQFDSYIAIDSLHVNGKLSLGENIADLGGILISFDAFQHALEGKDHKPIDGFTPEQRFFLSYAQYWRENMRPEMVKLLVNTDEHAPGNFRANGTLSNMPALHKAFGCEPGDLMMHDEKDLVRIW